MDIHYGGAPDECGYCFVWSEKIIKLNEDGSCPIDHTKFGPGSHFA